MQTNQRTEIRDEGSEMRDQRSEISVSRTTIHSFPSAAFLDHATASLLMMQECALGLAPSNNVKRLLARQSISLGPQVPNLKPAA